VILLLKIRFPLVYLKLNVYPHASFAAEVQMSHESNQLMTLKYPVKLVQSAQANQLVPDKGSALRILQEHYLLLHHMTAYILLMISSTTTSTSP
jgi:hypothetical protein